MRARRCDGAETRWLNGLTALAPTIGQETQNEHERIRS
jgi:hypothetical protein